MLKTSAPVDFAMYFAVIVVFSSFLCIRAAHISGDHILPACNTSNYQYFDNGMGRCSSCNEICCQAREKGTEIECRAKCGYILTQKKEDQTRISCNFDDKMEKEICCQIGANDNKTSESYFGRYGVNNSPGSGTNDTLVLALLTSIFVVALLVSALVIATKMKLITKAKYKICSMCGLDVTAVQETALNGHIQQEFFNHAEPNESTIIDVRDNEANTE